MGLDMYLYKRTYVQNWNHTPAEQKHNITVKVGGKVRKDIQRKRIVYIIEQVAYWRKFNALHNWFVEKCGDGEDNCQEISVSSTKLKELITDLKNVKISLDASPKKTIKVLSGWGSNGDKYSDINVFEDTGIAEELLPTRSGFFFGGTEYDEYYYQGVVETIKTLEALLAESDNLPKGLYSGDFYYRASW